MSSLSKDESLAREEERNNASEQKGTHEFCKSTDRVDEKDQVCTRVQDSMLMHQAEKEPVCGGPFRSSQSRRFTIRFIKTGGTEVVVGV